MNGEGWIQKVTWVEEGGKRWNFQAYIHPVCRLRPFHRTPYIISTRQAYSTILGLELCRELKKTFCQMPQIGVGEPCINLWLGTRQIHITQAFSMISDRLISDIADCFQVLKSYLMVWNIIFYIHNNLSFMILKIKELSFVAEHYITFNIIFV